MGFGESIKHVFSNMTNFSGRASRSEFWWFALFQLGVLVGLQPRNSSLGIREKKKPSVFSAELQIFDHGIFKR